MSTIIAFCHNRDDHDYHDDSEEGLLVNVQTVVIPIMNIEILWMEGLERMKKNQVRDLESNQTLIAKPFPELVTSRLVIMMLFMVVMIMIKILIMMVRKMILCEMV